MAIPALFAAVIGDVIAYCERPDVLLNRGKWRRRLVPLVPLAFVPPIIPLLAVVALVWTAVAQLLRTEWVARVGGAVGARLVIRGGWLAVATLGLVALIEDIRAIA